MYKLVCLLIIVSILNGCAGRTPHPIDVEKFNDRSLSCYALRSEMGEIKGKINKLIPVSNKTGKNVALGAAGLIVFPAWFFMDFSDADKIEMEAYQSRYNHLMRIYNDKKCKN